MKILVTGAAGFIGFHISKKLLEHDHHVFGLDNLNPYYDQQLKRDRLSQLEPFTNFKFEKLDLSDRQATKTFFKTKKFDLVLHLAAQAGVRHSINHPHDYIECNVTAFLNILEECRAQNSKPHLIFASSSSVYGISNSLPLKEDQNVDFPVSLYAATKKSNELMAHAYSKLYHFPVTGLRFFTVYGPWGRPDMAYFSFTKSILDGSTIRLFNQGKMLRDFTYIDDITESLLRICQKKPDHQYEIFNIGNHTPIHLIDFVKTLENEIGKKAKIEFTEMQPGDVLATEASVQKLENWINFIPNTSMKSGLKKFVQWYREYYKI